MTLVSKNLIFEYIYIIAHLFISFVLWFIGANDYVGYLSVPELYDEVFPAAYKSGARVHSNSWKDGVDAYNSYSYDVDAFTYKNDDFVVLFAAGNQGGQGLSSVATPSNAKNCIAVGASELRDPSTDSPLSNGLGNVAWFSSLGPTNDGRIKPDVIAPGSFVMSAYAGLPSYLQSAVSGNSNSKSGSSSGSYQQSCAAISSIGTSMSCPVAAGAALLIRQYFMDSSFWAKACNTLYSTCKSGAFTPSGYLVKAVLLHSGQQMSTYSTSDFNHKSTIPSTTLGSVPDMFQGYGSIILKNVLPLSSGLGLNPALHLVLWDALVLPENSAYMWTVTLTGSALLPLKVTVVWYDPPSEIGSVSSLLLHDLDLKVESPNGGVSWGNRLNGGDESNPNEQVYIATPSCYNSNCVYKVFVSTCVLPESDSQKFAIVITTSGQHFAFVSILFKIFLT